MKQKFHSVWFFFLLLAALPFFMRLGMDSRAATRQAVLQLYRDWRWSPAMRDLRRGQEILLEENQDKSFLRDFFKAQLQQDFKVPAVENANAKVPVVRAFFEDGSYLRVRIETQRLDQESAEIRVWQGEARVINNGLLLALWAVLLALIFGKSLLRALAMAAGIFLFWYAHWSLFQIPVQIAERLRYFGREIAWRVQSGDWSASEFGRLPELGVALWFVAAVPLCYVLFKKMAAEKSLRGIFICSLLLEPVALWTSSLFAHWAPDTSLWKLYLGSLCYRFLSLGVAFFAWMYPDSFSSELYPKLWRDQRRRFTSWALAVPPVLVFGGLWAWSNAVLSPGSSMVILRLKVFVVCFLLSFFLGSRIFSLWFGSLCLAVVLPPMTGHWNASALYGFLYDALLLGWFFSPFKGFSPVLLFNLNYRVFGPLLFMAWFLGVFLSSVGVPVIVSWIALALAIWTLGQVLDSPARKGAETHV